MDGFHNLQGFYRLLLVKMLWYFYLFLLLNSNVVILLVNKNRLLFSNAKMEKGRMNMTVRISYDEGESWTEGKCIYPGVSAYSSMTLLGNGDIGLFFEKDYYTENVFVSFSLEWLTDGEDSHR